MKLKSQRFGTKSFPADYEVTRFAALNKADLGGGNNKYYVLEAHTSRDGRQFRLYSRYGRVGHHGTEEERIPPQDATSLDAAFEYLKKSKTGKRKGYVEVKVASTKIGSSVAQTQVLSDDIKKEKVLTDGQGLKKKKNAPTADMHPSVRTLVERLYDEAGKAVRQQLSGSLQTSSENPLGTLTLGQIQQGRDILQDIQVLLGKKPSLMDTAHKSLLDLSNRFYSAIPQTMALRPAKKAGKKAMDDWLLKLALNNEAKLDEKEDLLKLLSDVKGMVSGFSTGAETKYTEIGCEYNFIDPKESQFKKIEKFVRGTRSRHHNWDSKVINIWNMRVKGQRKHVETMKKVGNIKPLFHGSRSANILGICKSGLLMRPPGVYITGSMFGNGLYFADSSSKSEQYSTSRFGGSSGRGNTFFMFVADVSLGKIKGFDYAQTHLVRPPAGYHSVQGVKGRSLLHDEFIIYNLSQHILQYLVEFKPQGRYW